MFPPQDNQERPIIIQTRNRSQFLNKDCCRACLEVIVRISCCLFVFGIIIGLVLFILLIPWGAGELDKSWPNNGHGLTITVINSCDNSWTDVFEEYIQHWGNGSPKSLQINTERHAPDTNGYCLSYHGRVNVCNGNYGFTDWIGITHTWGYQGSITSSIVKLNDYHVDGYLSKTRKMRKKRYLMCHELGHAFGLPHSDERHLNIDRGECMDYTYRYRNNLYPGKVNYEKLELLYGSFDKGTAVTAAARAANDTVTKNLQTPPPRQAAVSTMEEEESALPEYVRQVYTVLMECLETKSCSECKQEMSIVLDYSTLGGSKSNKGGEDCEFHLDEEYSLQTHKLLAQ